MMPFDVYSQPGDRVSFQLTPESCMYMVGHIRVITPNVNKAIIITDDGEEWSVDIDGSKVPVCLSRVNNNTRRNRGKKY